MDAKEKQLLNELKNAKTQQPQSSRDTQVEEFFNSSDGLTPVQAAAILAANRDQLSFNSFYIGELVNNCGTALLEAASKIQEQRDLEQLVKQEAKKLIQQGDSSSIEELVKQAAQNLLMERKEQVKGLVERETRKAIGTNMQEVNVVPLGGSAVAALSGTR